MNPGFYRGARVLVTGASGFLGQALSRWLLAAGAEVHGTSRSAVAPNGLLHPAPDGSRSAVATAPDGSRSTVVTGSIQWHQADLEGGALPALVKALRPAVVFHLAARMERDRRADLLVPMLAANALPVARLAEALVAADHGRLVVVGSAEEYGSLPGPWREEQHEEPASPYGLSKAAASTIVASAHRAYGLSAVVGRLSVVYGPGQRNSQFIPSLIASCLAGESFAMTPGEQLRDFLFVDDAVDGLATLGSGSHFGRVFNLCTGRSVAVIDLARRVESLIGRGRLDVGALAYRPSEAMKQELCPDAARELLGWQARVSLDEGLGRTIEAARADGLH